MILQLTCDFKNQDLPTDKVNIIANLSGQAMLD